MEYSHSNSESWTLKDIGNAVDQHNEQGRWFISLPKFQRSLVWSESQKLMLIDSLYRGFPIGTLLTFQTDAKSGRRIVLEAVDGLQRITTIVEYLKEPLSFAPVDSLFESDFIRRVADALELTIDDDGFSEATNRIAVWLQVVKVPKPNSGWNFSKFKESVGRGDPSTEGKLSDLDDDFQDAITIASERISEVNTSKIPVITYTGPIENIPTIFERINNQGTQLSKYEIFASTWLNAQTLVRNVEVRAAVKEKYDILLAAGYEITGYDSGDEISSDQFNLYEYLFGLGKVLARKFPYLFSSSASADEVNPIAFVLYTVILRLKVSDMASLAARMPRNDNGVIDPSSIEASIFHSCEQVEKSLRPYLRLKFNSTNDTIFIPHSQNQILSLVIQHLLNSHDLNDWSLIQSSTSLEIIENVSSHYLYDIIRNSWRGSGDSRLSSLAWDENGRPSSYYAKPVTRKLFSEALRTWHEEILGKKQRERASISSSVKATLVFVYANIVTVSEDEAISFEIEHIYPVAYLSERIRRTGNDGWPISAIGNLMILPKPINRIKGKNLLGDFLPTLRGASALTNSQLEQVQKFLIQPNWKSISKTPNVSKSAYIEFCKKRLENMETLLIDNLKLK
jgi:hypothetical protein